MASIDAFLIEMFFSQIYSSSRKKFYTDSIGLAINIAEITESKAELKELKKIYANTTDKLHIALPILDSVYSNSSRMRKSQSIEIFGKTVYVHEIIKGLADAYIQISFHVTKIAKRSGVNLVFDFNKYQVKE